MKKEPKPETEEMEVLKCFLYGIKHPHMRQMMQTSNWLHMCQRHEWLLLKDMYVASRIKWKSIISKIILCKLFVNRKKLVFLC